MTPLSFSSIGAPTSSPDSSLESNSTVLDSSTVLLLEEFCNSPYFEVVNRSLPLEGDLPGPPGAFVVMVKKCST